MPRKGINRTEQGSKRERDANQGKRSGAGKRSEKSRAVARSGFPSFCFFPAFSLLFSYFCPVFFLTFSLCLLGFSFFPLLQKSFSCAIIFMYRHYLTIISIIFHCHTSAFYGFIGCIRGTGRMRAEARLLGFGLKENEKPKNRESEELRNRETEKPRNREDVRLAFLRPVSILPTENRRKE